MSRGAPDLRPGETGDTALGGAVGVIQPSRGYRFGIDPILLARFAAERPVSLALDLGCGSGVVGLSLLALGGAQRIVGLDVQAEMIDRARRAARWNGWAETRARFELGDLRNPEVLKGSGPYPLVVANPPYFRVGEGRPSPEPSKAISRTTVKGTLGQWVDRAAEVLESHGSFCVVLPETRQGELVDHCRSAGLCPVVLRAVRAHPDGENRFVLTRFGWGTVSAPEVRPPLVLHGAGRRYSAEADHLLGSP